MQISTGIPTPSVPERLSRPQNGSFKIMHFCQEKIQTSGFTNMYIINNPLPVADTRGCPDPAQLQIFAYIILVFQVNLEKNSMNWPLQVPWLNFIF